MTPWRCAHGLTSLQTCAACGRVVSGMTLDELRTFGRFVHAAPPDRVEFLSGMTLRASASVPSGEAFLIPVRRPHETDDEYAARCVHVVNIGEEENDADRKY